MSRIGSSTRFYYFMSIIIIASVNTVHTQTGKKRIEAVEIKYIAEALYRGLAYFKGNAEAKTVDVALGVFLTRANLRWIWYHLSTSDKPGNIFVGELRQLLAVCDVLIDEFFETTYSIASPKEITILKLLKKYLGHSAAEDLKYEKLTADGTKFEETIFSSCSQVNEYMMRGTPNDSDSCIIQLARKTCDISKECLFEETGNGNHSGYKTTHRLLFLQLASKVHCETRNPREMSNLTDKKRSLCHQIFEEAIFLERKYILLTRDLFLEQIALCGFEGYVQFAKRKWRNIIPSWQSEKGCFGLAYDEEAMRYFCSSDARVASGNFRARVKKSDTVLKDFCHTHTSAVALPSMAFHLRVAMYEF